MTPLRVTLDQWRALVAVVEEGGYAKAAQALHKSQSAVTYAVQRLESLLGVAVFEIRGRRAELTQTGALLYRRARALLDDADEMERVAGTLSAGWEAEITLAVEVVFPIWLLLQSLHRFGLEAPQTHIELVEMVRTGGPEALRSGRAQLAILSAVPSGFLGETLLRVRFIPVAHPDHALHTLGRPLGIDDLRSERHLVVRESGPARDSTLTLESTQRWTVSNMSTSIGAACRGHGFAWYPEDKIRAELADGILKPLPMQRGAERIAQLYLVLPDKDAAGPGTLRLAEIIREDVRNLCTANANDSAEGSDLTN